jgi:hypothetical protein
VTLDLGFFMVNFDFICHFEFTLSGLNIWIYKLLFKKSITFRNYKGNCTHQVLFLGFKWSKNLGKSTNASDKMRLGWRAYGDFPQYLNA